MSNNRANVTILEKQVKSNYAIAQRYYEILKEHTFNYLATQMGAKVDTKIETILNVISQDWIAGYQEKTKKALRNALQSKEDSFSVDSPVGSPVDSMKFKITLPKDSTKAVTKKDIESKLGFIYEQFASQIFQLYFRYFEFNDKIIARQTSAANITNAAGIRTKGTQQISDMVVALDQIAKKPEVIAMNLSAGIINNINRLIYIKGIKNDDQFFSNFGINIKKYSSNDVNGHSFTSAKQISIDLLNNSFLNSWSTGNCKSWNKKYAQATADLYVSTQLINILGPQNIYILFGNEYNLMSQFIQNHSIYTNIYYNKELPNEEIIQISTSPTGNIKIGGRNGFPFAEARESKYAETLSKRLQTFLDLLGEKGIDFSQKRPTIRLNSSVKSKSTEKTFTDMLLMDFKT